MSFMNVLGGLVQAGFDKILKESVLLKVFLEAPKGMSVLCHVYFISDRCRNGIEVIPDRLSIYTTHFFI